jgi:hypothetical protein
MSPVPGILHVLTDPGPNVTLDEFHDWYNNEHGPARMRLYVENLPMSLFFYSHFSQELP